MAPGLKELVLPPSIALAVYLFVIYAVMPMYRQRQRYTQYVPISIPSGSLPSGWLARTRDWAFSILSIYADLSSGVASGRRYSGLSDEELDAVEDLGELHQQEAPGSEHGDRADNQRRLSRDLEAGFRDDSDDEDD